MYTRTKNIFKNEQKVGMLLQKRTDTRGVGISSMRKSISPYNHTHRFHPLPLATPASCSPHPLATPIHSTHSPQLSSILLTLQKLKVWFAAASLLFVHFFKCFSFLFQFFFVIKFYVLNNFFTQYKHTYWRRRASHSSYMKAAHNVLYTKKHIQTYVLYPAMDISCITSRSVA